MGFDRTDTEARRYPGEWVAIANGQVVAHGPDLGQVAQEACEKARDIAFERVPDPRAPLWRPARREPIPAPRPARRRPLRITPVPAPSPSESARHPFGG